MRAFVREVTGRTRHLRGAEVIPPAHYVEIVLDEDAFLLLHFDVEGNELADTWHESIAAAKRQAEFEYRIGDGDWIEVR
ncbi:MAG: hypothetical protein H6812_12165 [Phycisphaeraceae bacterium]|nr:hypothetical protein [Phycisphaeraceae bacterium]